MVRGRKYVVTVHWSTAGRSKEVSARRGGMEPERNCIESATNTDANAQASLQSRKVYHIVVRTTLTRSQASNGGGRLFSDSHFATICQNDFDLYSRVQIGTSIWYDEY